MIRVLIVEDSPTFRLLMRAILSADPQVTVVGLASNGEEALSQVEALKPDLITMDITMPVMNGYEATREIMGRYPTPIIVVSTLTDLAESMASFQAIQAGALEVLPKPVAMTHPDFALHRDRLLETVRRLAQLRLRMRTEEPEGRARPAAHPPSPAPVPTPTPPRPPTQDERKRPEASSSPRVQGLSLPTRSSQGGGVSSASAPSASAPSSSAPSASAPSSSHATLTHTLPGGALTPLSLAPVATRPGSSQATLSPGTPVSTAAAQATTTVRLMRKVLVPPQVVAIGASTGGPAALRTVLKMLPAEFPLPLVAVQHITEGYLNSFVQWLQQDCAIRIKVAEEGTAIRPGTLYFAPDSMHLEVLTGGLCHLSSGPPVSFVRPSATVLLESVARTYGAGAIGVLLTGMGDDGAKGLLSMRRAGAHTLVQDEATCIVYGMPRVANELGAAEWVLPLDRIAPQILHGLSSEG